MSGDAEALRSAELEPDLDLARRTANVAHSVVIKLQEMQLPEGFNDDLASLSTDLGDLWSSQVTLSNRLEALSRSLHDWEAVGDCLVDLTSCLDHIAYHLKSVRRPLRKISRYAFRQAAVAKNEG